MQVGHRAAIAFSAMLAGALVVGGMVVSSMQNAGNDATNVVRKYLEAERDNDYDAWISTLIEEKQKAFTREANGEFGVISLTVDKVEISDEETQRMKERYQGSDLARKRGWSAEYISNNMTVVAARYRVDFDNTRVPHKEGTLAQSFILVRDNKGSPWLIWDATSPAD